MITMAIIISNSNIIIPTLKSLTCTSSALWSALGVCILWNTFSQPRITTKNNRSPAERASYVEYGFWLWWQIKREFKEEWSIWVLIFSTSQNFPYLAPLFNYLSVFKYKHSKKFRYLRNNYYFFLLSVCWRECTDFLWEPWKYV